MEQDYFDKIIYDNWKHRLEIITSQTEQSFQMHYFPIRGKVLNGGQFEPRCVNRFYFGDQFDGEIFKYKGITYGLKYVPGIKALSSLSFQTDYYLIEIL